MAVIFPKKAALEVGRLVQLAAKYNCDVRTKSGEIVRLPIRSGNNCEHCGTVYLTRRPDQKFCSPACKQAANNAKFVAKRKGEPWNPATPKTREALRKECVRCGTAFSARRGNVKYCSDECFRLAKNANWVAKFSKGRAKRHRR